MSSAAPPADLFLSSLGATYADPEDDVAAGGDLDEAATATLTAMSARLIPGDEHWPSGDAVDAPAHIAAVLRRAPQLRDAVLALIAELEPGFADDAPDRQTAALRRVEAAPEHAAAFRAVYEWVCEAYYRHPSVVPVIRERTGFDLGRPLVGTPMAPFDESRLDRVRGLPPRYREVPA